MTIRDLGCTKSMTFSNDNQEDKAKTICIGTQGIYEYWSYVYFDLSLIPSPIKLNTAKLILFKLPHIPAPNYQNQCTYGTWTNRYYCIPSLDYISPYSYLYRAPHLEEDKKIVFSVPREDSYVEIEMTQLMKLWLDNSLENKGILLRGDNNSPQIIFASEQETSGTLGPFLRITYSEEGGPPQPVPPSMDLPLSIKLRD